METIKIETSLGIIEIPKKVIGKNPINLDYTNEDWFIILNKLYEFEDVYLINENWIGINLSDSHYGNPEYKILKKEI